MIAATGVLLALAASASGAPRVLHVRANAAFGACLAPALEEYNRTSPVPAALVTADPDPPSDAALVVGDDLEMTRLLEGGTAELASAYDLGYLPWVTVVPVGTQAGALSAAGASRVAVLGGRAGREARASLGGLPAERLHVERDAVALRASAYALVPRSLAGAGEHRPAGVRPLVATAAVIAASPQANEARRLLAFLREGPGAPHLRRCLDPAPGARAATARAAEYAQSVVDWWLPQCTLDRNGYKDPQLVVGGPDAANLGGRDNYRGIMSLGQGGYVTVDMGQNAVDGPGADIRVFQATTGEEVTLYASAAAGGPFVLIGLRVPCGVRTPGTFSNHCDFDLAGTGLTSARYLKVEDGEIYPCLAAGTLTEGADIDAVQILNAQ